MIVNTAMLVPGRHKEIHLGIPQSPAVIMVAVGTHDSRHIGLRKLTNGVQELAHQDHRHHHHHHHSCKDSIVPLGHPLHGSGPWRFQMSWGAPEMTNYLAVVKPAMVGKAAAAAQAAVACKISRELVDHPHRNLVNLRGRTMVVVKSLGALGAAEHA